MRRAQDPDANATAHERFAPSSTAAGAARGGKVALEATPRSPGPPGGEGERRRLHTAMAPSSGAVGGHDSTKNSKRDETFFGEWSYNGRLYHISYRSRSVSIAFGRRGESHRRDLLLFGAHVFFFFFDAGVFFVVLVLKVVGYVCKPLSSWRGIT